MVVRTPYPFKSEKMGLQGEGACSRSHPVIPAFFLTANYGLKWGVRRTCSHHPVWSLKTREAKVMKSKFLGFSDLIPKLLTLWARVGYLASQFLPSFYANPLSIYKCLYVQIPGCFPNPGLISAALHTCTHVHAHMHRYTHRSTCV